MTVPMSIASWALDPKSAALSRFAEPVIDSYLDGIRAIGAKKRPALRKVRA